MLQVPILVCLECLFGASIPVVTKDDDAQRQKWMRKQN